jgi:predicted nucleic acid-binding protein
MIGPSFVDTNILLYARDASEAVKQPMAEQLLYGLWANRTGRLSFQVLQEYYNNATRKLKPGLPVAMAREDVRSLLTWKPLRADEVLLDMAWALMDRYGFSWWDAQIVAAAKRLSCARLLSEDMQHGLDIDGMSIVNPFLGGDPL